LGAGGHAYRFSRVLRPRPVAVQLSDLFSELRNPGIRRVADVIVLNDSDRFVANDLRRPKVRLAQSEVYRTGRRFVVEHSSRALANVPQPIGGSECHKSQDIGLNESAQSRNWFVALGRAMRYPIARCSAPGNFGGTGKQR